jgi:hypothetical protein
MTGADPLHLEHQHILTDRIAAKDEAKRFEPGAVDYIRRL